MGGQIDFYQSNRFAIGPMLQLGIDDDFQIVAPSLHGKFLFPVGNPARLSPFAQAGIGFLWAERDGPGNNEDDIGLLLQVGGGVEWELDDQTFLASSITVDLLPSEVLDENAIFTWQIIQAGFRF
jgi:hypothetical protein